MDQYVQDLHAAKSIGSTEILGSQEIQFINVAKVKNGLESIH